MSHEGRSSATSRVFAILMAGVLAVSVIVTALLMWDSRRAEYRHTERTTQALAIAIASAPETAIALSERLESERVALMQEHVSELRRDVGVSYITVMDRDGTRFTHPDPEQIGKRYRGTIPDAPHRLTERWTGTLGPSVRTIAPVTESSGATVGWVSVGITVSSIAEKISDEIPLALAVSGTFAVIGGFAAFAARRVTRRITGDLSAEAVRDALISHDSLRSLSESLAAQTHEHGNRLHAAIALLELGRQDEAIDMLAATALRSQELADVVAAPEALDPAVSALIVGKTAQAAERGVSVAVDIAPELPKLALGAMELVSVIGNLMDNAIDAAASSKFRPRVVELRMHPGERGHVQLTVSDSGEGFTLEARRRMFDWGVSTKQAHPGREAEGRGVGLALVHRIVGDCGGTIVAHEAPTTFVVRLPRSDTGRTASPAPAPSSGAISASAAEQL
ncbi:ATP-binding protein [Leucobacter sp. NPDC077196]|uniref:sensor histidine kinase n=1 Tax=Leucobacter sp. NPDC077196 TaxID=3154959 RepID=UPI00343C0FB1